jgi:heme/copper-type cytochrome/quinol oxidase subunit 2
LSFSGLLDKLRQQNPDISKIREYFIWSIINIFIGSIFGIVAVCFSCMTRYKKRKNDFNEAKKWSKRTLIFNIIVTVLVILSIGLAMSEWHAELGRLSSEY